MGRTACTEPQCLYEGALYFILLVAIDHEPNSYFCIAIFFKIYICFILSLSDIIYIIQ